MEGPGLTISKVSLPVAVVACSAWVWINVDAKNGFSFMAFGALFWLLVMFVYDQMNH
jgi:hypothetical protein